jgi:hypothetical protein
MNKIKELMLKFTEDIKTVCKARLQARVKIEIIEQLSDYYTAQLEQLLIRKEERPKEEIPNHDALRYLYEPPEDFFIVERVQVSIYKTDRALIKEYLEGLERRGERKQARPDLEQSKQVRLGPEQAPEASKAL